MRIDRLGLARYGHFDDHVVDFGVSSRDIDLHVIYGDNEAGKSTTYHALLDLLFGIARKSEYAFRFERKDMRIEALLRKNDSVHELARTGRGLTDKSGNLLDDMTLAPLLDGLDRGAYNAMFSMDEESLEQGGRDILASKGDLGHLLFSAGSGLGDLNTRLESLLVDTAGAYYGKGTKRDWPLKKAIASIQELDTELKSFDIQVAEWKRRQNTVAVHKEAVELARQEHESAIRHFSRVQKLSDAHARAAGLIQDRKDLEEAEPVPVISAEWWSDIDTFIDQAQSLLSEKSELEKQIARADTALAEPPPDRDLLDSATDILTLRDQVAVLNAGEKQLIDSRESEREERGQAESAMRKLGLPVDTPLESLEDPLFDVNAQELCRTLALQHGSLIQAVKLTRTQLEEQQTDRAGLGTCEPSSLPDPAALRRAIDDITDDTQTQQLPALGKQRIELDDELHQGMDMLAPWRGDVSALRAIDPPDDQLLERLATRLESAKTSHARNESECKVCLDQLRQLQSSPPGTSDVLDDTHWQKLRETLWRNWREHQDVIAARATMEQLQGTALHVEQSLRALEFASIERDQNLDRIAQRRAANDTLDKQASRYQELEETLTASNDDIHVAQQSIDALATSLGLVTGLSTTAIQSWLVQRDAVLTTARKLESIDRQIAACRTLRTRHCQRLLALLKDSGEPEDMDVDTSLEQRLKQSRARVATIDQLVTDATNLNTRIAQSDAALVAAEAGSTRAQQALSDWEARWLATVDGSALANLEISEAIKQVEEITRLASARRHVVDSEKNARRHETMRQGHEKAVKELVDRFSALIDSSRSNQLAALVSTLELAQQLDQQRKQHELTRNTARQTLENLIEDNAEQLDELHIRYAQTGTSTLHDLQFVLGRCQQRAERTVDIERSTAQLLSDLREDSPEALQSLVARDPADLESDVRIAETNRQHALEQLEQRNKELNDAEHSLSEIGDGDTVTLLRERRAAAWQQLLEQTHAALAVRLGIGAAREGIRQWRSNHRSEMLANANATFVTLTNGRFTSLSAEPVGGGEERLFARTADGNIKSADQLSKGTRFQLYLALRVAAYQRWCRDRSPPPFVADDVLETFDDDRTASTFRAFHEMAHHGQVIYLTHHRHVVDIAHDVTDGQVQVHELPSPRTASAASNRKASTT